jgi:hypothetical protein
VKFTEHFHAKYACIGDTIRLGISQDVDVIARIQFDQDTRPEHSEGYETRHIKQWERDEWFFVGIVLAIEVNGRLVKDHVGSLWGIDCNFGPDNNYLTEVANDLLSEHLDEVADVLDSIGKAASAGAEAIKSQRKGVAQ